MTLLLFNLVDGNKYCKSGKIVIPSLPLEQNTVETNITINYGLKLVSNIMFCFKVWTRLYQTAIVLLYSHCSQLQNLSNFKPNPPPTLNLWGTSLAL